MACHADRRNGCGRSYNRTISWLVVPIAAYPVLVWVALHEGTIQEKAACWYLIGWLAVVGVAWLSPLDVESIATLCAVGDTLIGMRILGWQPPESEWSKWWGKGPPDKS